MDDEAMITRAVQAYYRRGPAMDYLSRDNYNCDVRQVDGTWYVVLRNTSDLRGVYEVVGPVNGNWKLRGIEPAPDLVEKLRY